MTTTAIAAFFKLYKGSVDYALYQNFFVGKTVNGHGFLNFDTSSIGINRTADEGGATLTMPARQDLLDQFNTAITDEALGYIKMYELPVGDSMPTDLSNAQVVAEFLGEIITIQTDLTTLTVEIGASFDAVTGEVPGRKITTSLVGRLPSL